MSDTTNIIMGDDEFILYIRKNYENCTTVNNILGRQISEWFKELSIGVFKKDVPCYWDIDSNMMIGPIKLPETAAQFCFPRNLLPDLYTKLDQLGSHHK